MQLLAQKIKDIYFDDLKQKVIDEKSKNIEYGILDFNELFSTSLDKVIILL